MDELRHECGIAAVYAFDPSKKSPVWTGGADEVHRLMPRMLLDLQNRGQLSAGFTTYNTSRDQILDKSKPSVRPKPRQVEQAPMGLLKLKRPGVGAGSLMSQSAQRQSVEKEINCGTGLEPVC